MVAVKHKVHDSYRVIVDDLRDCQASIYITFNVSG